jgi:hypothetical protein
VFVTYIAAELESDRCVTVRNLARLYWPRPFTPRCVRIWTVKKVRKMGA